MFECGYSWSYSLFINNETIQNVGVCYCCQLGERYFLPLELLIIKHLLCFKHNKSHNVAIYIYSSSLVFIQTFLNWLVHITTSI